MTKYSLPPDVYYCEIDDGAIFLDLQTRKYLAIDSKSFCAFKNALTNTPEIVDQGGADGLGDLLACGVLTCTNLAARALPSARMLPDRSIAPLRHAGTHLSHPIRDSLLAIFCMASVAFHLKHGHLSRLLHHLMSDEAGTRDISSVTEPDVAALVSSFRRISLWIYPRKEACLFDSIALTKFLRRAKVPATFVIGVATKPFEAHAWVQLGTTVLNDSLECAQSYVPILNT